MKKTKLSYDDYKNVIKKAQSDDMKLGIVLDGIATQIENSSEDGRTRFGKLEKEFDIVFPKGSASRGISEAIIWGLMKSALELYFIGSNSALFIELHAFLERFALDELPKFLSVNDLSEEMIKELINKKTLPELSEYFERLEIWNEEDIKFTRKLTKIRNGIAHKNVELVSKQLGDGKDNSISSIHEITKKVDCIPYILSCMQLIVKLTGIVEKRKVRNPRFEVRHAVYKRLIPRIYNLFMEPDIQAIREPAIRKLILSSIFSEAELISSDILGDLLIEYENMVFRFHMALLIKDDDESEKLHKQLLPLVEKIHYAMKKDLGFEDEVQLYENQSNSEN